MAIQSKFTGMFHRRSFAAAAIHLILRALNRRCLTNGRADRGKMQKFKFAKSKFQKCKLAKIKITKLSSQSFPRDRSRNYFPQDRFVLTIDGKTFASSLHGP
jgi:hypothetical protein